MDRRKRRVKLELEIAALEEKIELEENPKAKAKLRSELNAINQTE